MSSPGDLLARDAQLLDQYAVTTDPVQRQEIIAARTEITKQLMVASGQDVESRPQLGGQVQTSKADLKKIRAEAKAIAKINPELSARMMDAARAEEQAIADAHNHAKAVHQRLDQDGEHFRRSTGLPTPEDLTNLRDAIAAEPNEVVRAALQSRYQADRDAVPARQSQESTS